MIDAVAVGQFTPGPVFTTGTFIGYVVAGVPGAVVATIGIFLALVRARCSERSADPEAAAVGPRRRVPRRVNVAALALMAVVGVRLAKSALVDVPTILLAAASALALFRWRVNSAWSVLGGGVVGTALQWLR